MLPNVGGSLEISGNIDDDSLGREKKKKKKKKTHVRLSVEVLKPDGQDLGFRTWTHGQTDRQVN